MPMSRFFCELAALLSMFAVIYVWAVLAAALQS